MEAIGRQFAEAVVAMSLELSQHPSYTWTTHQGTLLHNDYFGDEREEADRIINQMRTCPIHGVQRDGWL